MSYPPPPADDQPNPPAPQSAPPEAPPTSAEPQYSTPQTGAYQPAGEYPGTAYQPGSEYQPGSGYPPAGDYPGAGANYAVPGYPQGYQYGYGYPQPRPPVNGLAIASLVVSCAAVAGICAYGIGGLLGIVGAILGHVGRSQARRRGEGGEGMALAGIIVGWACTALALLAIGTLVYFIVSSESDTSATF